MASLLYRLGRFAARRRWSVLITWLVALALAGVGFSLFAGTVSSSISLPGTPTEKVTSQLTKALPDTGAGSGSLVFATTDGHAFTRAQKKAVGTLLHDVARFDGVAGTTNPFTAQQKLTDQRATIAQSATKIADGTRQVADARAQLDQAQKQLDTQRRQAEAAGIPGAAAQLDGAQKTIDANSAKLDAEAAKLAKAKATLDLGRRLLKLTGDAGVVSHDGSAAIGTVSFDRAITAVPAGLKDSIVDAADHADIAGVTVSVSNEIAETIPSVIGIGEIVGVLIAALVLVLTLSTVIGAAIPLVSALFGVGVAVLAAMSFSSIVEFVSVTPVLGLMLGLAVGIDYSLFILNRHRKQLKQGFDVHESIGLANGTSGNAVVFAGSTVIVALLALNVTGISFLGLMGTVGAVAVAVAILIAVTFTPAVLSLVGKHILRKGERARIGDPAAVRIPDRPMKTWRAIVTLVAGMAVLGVVALPATQMRLGLPDGASQPTNSSQYRAYQVVNEKFGAGHNAPLVVLATLPEKATGDAMLRRQVQIGEKLAAQSDVDAVVPIGVGHDNVSAAFEVVPGTGPASEKTEQLVHDLRGLSPLTTASGPVTIGVAGNASANIDISDKLAGVLPLYLALVVGLSLIILIIVFRSFLVPLTATAGFVLSLLAAFGGLTAVYQFGWLGAVFGVHDPAPILSFLPIIEVGVLFGLAMDYELFLVSGMREAFAHGSPARLAVQQGFHAGRSVVTAAAIIMISVFAGFVFSDSTMIRPVGFGLAFGVLVDAFVVRMLLIPSAMHLLGKAAWWFPRWLDRLLPDVDVEGAKLERRAPAGQPEAPTTTQPVPTP
ncbi:MAG TPA: MMPL family transporter [Microbacteriaceae bacterium]|nr:MMPL family transporter [Microbacteriaceae bacterium]